MRQRNGGIGGERGERKKMGGGGVRGAREWGEGEGGGKKRREEGGTGVVVSETD